MEKTYTFKQVILGLRKEYLKMEKELLELKKYLNITDKVEVCDFCLDSAEDKMFLYLEAKKTLMDKVLIKFGFNVAGKYYDVSDNIKSTYSYKRKKLCDVWNYEDTNENIKEIKNSEFNKNIVANNQVPIPCLENEKVSLIIDKFGIDLFSPFFLKRISYFPKNDEIFVKSVYGLSNEDEIFKLFNLSLKASYLNNYHTNVLDRYEDKRILIEDFNGESIMTFSIKEEKDFLVLKRK